MPPKALILHRVVYVSSDANGNGKADDEWYELAGSEYGKTGERRNLKMVYTRPDNVTPSDGMVEWVPMQSTNRKRNLLLCQGSMGGHSRSGPHG